MNKLILATEQGIIIYECEGNRLVQSACRVTNEHALRVIFHKSKIL